MEFNQSLELMHRVGKSKMDKLEEQFTRTHKETALQIIRELGTEAFTLWWYIEGKCYGREKIHAYPSKKLMAKELGKNERTIRRWEEKLEKAGALRRVPAYLPSGYRTTNLVLINAAFPEIPDGWDDMFPFGITIDGYNIKERQNPDEIAPDKCVHTEISGENAPSFTTEEIEESQKNSPGQICPHQEIAPDKCDRHSRTDMSASKNDEIPCGSKDEGAFLGGGIRKEKEEKKEEEEEENIRSKQQSIFLRYCDFLHINSKMKINILKKIGSPDNYSTVALINAFESLRDRVKKVSENKIQPIRNLPNWFESTLDGAETTYLMLNAENKREEELRAAAERKAIEMQKINFPMYNWLESENE